MSKGGVLASTVALISAAAALIGTGVLFFKAGAEWSRTERRFEDLEKARAEAGRDFSGIRDALSDLRGAIEGVGALDERLRKVEDNLLAMASSTADVPGAVRTELASIIQTCSALSQRLAAAESALASAGRVDLDPLKEEVAGVRRAGAEIERRVAVLEARSSSAPTRAPTGPAPVESPPDHDKGAARLEIYKAAAIGNLPDLPVMQTTWKRPMDTISDKEAFQARSGVYFLIPDRAKDLAFGDTYVARFSWVLDAKTAGKYGFAVNHETRSVRLIVDGKPCIQADAAMRSAQGIADLGAGLHQVEFLLLGCIGSDHPMFTLRMLAPGADDSVVVGANELLLPKR